MEEFEKKKEEWRGKKLVDFFCLGAFKWKEKKRKGRKIGGSIVLKKFFPIVMRNKRKVEAKLSKLFQNTKLVHKLRMNKFLIPNSKLFHFFLRLSNNYLRFSFHSLSYFLFSHNLKTLSSFLSSSKLAN